jgi:hypothetical protein
VLELARLPRLQLARLPRLRSGFGGSNQQGRGFRSGGRGGRGGGRGGGRRFEFGNAAFDACSGLS